MQSTNLILPLNLQFFADGIDNFDLDAFDQKWNEELEIESEEDELGSSSPEEEELEDDELEDDEPEEVEEDNSEDIHSEDEQKRNAAFAELRRERDQFKQQQEWIKQLAAESGLSVEQLKERYEEQQLAKQAEEKGVPVDVLKRLTSLENENKTMKEQTQAERLNAEIVATLEKYESDQDGFDRTVQYTVEHGIANLVSDGIIPFEQAFRLAHMDDMLEEAKQKAVQDNLAQKKKRQQEATPPVGNGVIPSGDDIDELVSKDVKAILENGGF